MPWTEHSYNNMYTLYSKTLRYADAKIIWFQKEFVQAYTVYWRGYDWSYTHVWSNMTRDQAVIIGIYSRIRRELLKFD